MKSIILVIYLLVSCCYVAAQSINELDVFEDLPMIEIKSNMATVNKYYFLAVNKLGNKYLMIIDGYLTPIYLKKFKNQIHDFKVQENGYLTYYSEDDEKYYMLDSSYAKIDSFSVSSNYIQNFHDIKITSNEHVLVLGDEYNLVNMDTVISGGYPNATVVGNILQEYDENKNLIFQWRANDYYNIKDSYVSLMSQYIDYAHINSYMIDNDENLIISSRNLSEITKIDRQTGDIIWRLGGKNNEFELIGDTVLFSAQHTVSRDFDGGLTVYDNGNFTTQISRGVKYELDENNKVITLINEYKTHDELFSSIMGGMQNLPDGNKLIGWGKNFDYKILTEFNSDGELVYELKSTDQSYCYRAFRYPWKTNLFECNTDTIDFSNVNSGEITKQTVYITNNSQEEIQLTSYSNHDTVFKINNTFPISISAKGNIELDVEFKPSKYGGDYKDILTLNYDKIVDGEYVERIGIQVNLKGLAQDVISPEVCTYPANNVTNFPIDTVIIIQFDEPIRYIDNSELSEKLLKSCISLNAVNSSGEKITYDATYDFAQYQIKISNIKLQENKEYILTVTPHLEDYSNNLINRIEVNFRTGATNNVVSVNRMEGIIISPNPFENEILVKLHEDLIRIVEIYSLDGKMLSEYEIQLQEEAIINTRSYSSGFYIIKVITKDGKSFSGRIIKL